MLCFFQWGSWSVQHSFEVQADDGALEAEVLNRTSWEVTQGDAMLLLKSTFIPTEQLIHTALQHQTINLPLVGEPIPTRMESNEDGVISKLYELDRQMPLLVYKESRRKNAPLGGYGAFGVKRQVFPALHAPCCHSGKWWFTCSWSQVCRAGMMVLNAEV